MRWGQVQIWPHRLYQVLEVMTMDIHYVNEHRAALGRELFPVDLPEAEVQAHLALIDQYAPYGQDPWLEYEND